MSSLLKNLTKLAQSPQGKKLVDKAQQFANDPKTKEQVEKAKLKLAEMRSGGSTGGTAGGSSGGTAGGSTAGTTGTTPPKAAREGDASSGGPTAA